MCFLKLIEQIIQMKNLVTFNILQQNKLRLIRNSENLLKTKNKTIPYRTDSN